MSLLLNATNLDCGMHLEQTLDLKNRLESCHIKTKYTFLELCALGHVYP